MQCQKEMEKTISFCFFWIARYLGRKHYQAEIIGIKVKLLGKKTFNFYIYNIFFLVIFMQGKKHVREGKGIYMAGSLIFMLGKCIFIIEKG